MAEVAARQWGVVDVDELRAAGLTDDAIAVRVRKGWLHPLHRRVYAVGHPNPPMEGRFLGALKACPPGTVLSHMSAAALWDFVPWDRGLPEVTLPGSSTSLQPSLRAHRTRTLGLDEVAEQRGLAVTAPARTIIDIASSLGERTLRRVVREAQGRGQVSLAALVAAVESNGRRAGTRRLRRLLAAGPAPTRSVLEDVVLDLILRGGLEPPDVNVPLRLGDRTVVPDFRWPRQRIVVEADGAAWHDNRLARQDDATRQALLEAHGERVLRVTWDQAIQRATETLARLCAAGVPVVSTRSTRRRVGRHASGVRRGAG